MVFAEPKQVLDHGSVQLVASCASDLTVVNAARVSYGAFKTEMDDGDAKLINYLMREHHGTPFEHNFFSFRIKAPIFIFREWHRHRIGMSYNEMSARYTTLTDEFYVPKISAVRVRVGKPGNYKYEQAERGDAINYCQLLRHSCQKAYGCYLDALQTGIAPEQARCFLHVNHYSEMIFSCNARSLMSFLALRAAPTAQWEIQQYANVLEDIFDKIMPVTHRVFVNNGRVAP